MKNLVVVLNQTVENQTVTEKFTVNIVESSEFSAKQFRKLFQRAANNVLNLDGKQLAISKGRKFQMSMNLDGIEISKFSAFYNSSEKIQHNFNRNLKTRLNAAIIDLKDAITE